MRTSLPDSFDDSYRLVVALPKSHSFKVPGGHSATKDINGVVGAHQVGARYPQREFNSNERGYRDERLENERLRAHETSPSV